MKKEIGVIVLIVLIVGVSAFFYSYFYQSQVNYLIPGVPYYGFYNHFFGANSTLITSVASLLGYWGDTRFSSFDLMGYFYKDRKISDAITTQEIADFFKLNGYNVERWISEKPGNEISEIKKFVNQDKKIPVIVYQKRSLAPDNQQSAFRVVIGLSDRDKKVTVHDYAFGNNFQISYDDFNRMFLLNARAFLSVWPTDDLRKKIKGPNYDTAYSGRMAAMDEMGDYLARQNEINFYFLSGDYAKALEIQQKFIGDEKFNSLPPAYRVYFNTFLAKIFLGLNQPAKAIEIIIDKVLPLNFNLDEPFDGWTEQISYFKDNNYSRASLAYPYYALGLAYTAEGDKTLAKKNFEEVLRINPGYKLTPEVLQQLK